MSKVINQGWCVYFEIDDRDPALEEIVNRQSNDGFDCVKGAKHTNSRCRNTIFTRDRLESVRIRIQCVNSDRVMPHTVT